MKYFCLFILLSAISSGYGQQRKDFSDRPDGIPTFEMVSVPDTLVGPEARADYLAMHYWDRFDFSDTVSIGFPEVTEQAFVDYLDALRYVTFPTVCSSLEKMVKQAETDPQMLLYFTGLYEKYLYEPDSPFRNEEWLIPVLQLVSRSSILKEADMIRPAYLLEQILKNRLGKPATDFTYTSADGQPHSLYGVDSPRLLLFFYDPDCHTCQETIEKMIASPILEKQIASAKLTVLAVYPGEDEEIWQMYHRKLPASWISGYDPDNQLINDELYDLKRFPTLYLLDRERKILLKDAAVEQIINFLQLNK